jgi:hypothetical protein
MSSEAQTKVINACKKAAEDDDDEKSLAAEESLNFNILLLKIRGNMTF